MVVIYDLVGWIILKNRLARTLMTPHCRVEYNVIKVDYIYYV